MLPAAPAESVGAAQKVDENEPMSACPQCGTAVKPGDKFCNICGAPIPRTNAPQAAPAGAALQESPPPPFQPPLPTGPSGQSPGAGGYASGSPSRCQLGHEIAPGASYCAQGHPIALDQMPFSNDPYAAPSGAPQPPGGFGVAIIPQVSGGFPSRPSVGGTPPPPPLAQPPAPAAYGPANQAAYAAAYGTPPNAASPSPFQGAQPPYNPPAYAPPSPPGYSAEPARDASPPRTLRGFLVAYGANPLGDFWPLTGGRHTVGRFGTGDGLDIPLQDPTISSRHAALLVDAASGTVAVEDTASTNGTFVNDEHIGYSGRRDLRDGDRLRFGGFTTIVKVIGRV